MHEHADDALTEAALDHLRALVSFDTTNPPRRPAESGIFEYLVEHLVGFEVERDDLGDGCVSLHARRGEPTVLFNFHVDTVPACEGWPGDPLALQVDGGRAVGLGACDIKGASACMLAAVAQSDGDVGLLFTSDEEAGSSRCVRRFVEVPGAAYETVVVAEPTRGQAVLEHRGILTGSVAFEGRPGHASERRALRDSAAHALMRWGAGALAFAEAHEQSSYGPLSGIRLNIGRVEGGIKPNMIAASARARFGCRPLPDQDADALLAALKGLVEEGSARWESGFRGPTLPAGAATAAAARAWAAQAGLSVAAPVDFWTEASLFSEAGYTALVYGPGDIAQAHTAGEWVALDQLADVARTYVRLLESGITQA